MTEPTVIAAAPPESPGLDYEALVDEALEILQVLTGDAWTDHNVSDPGITILENVCFALSDLCFRITFPIPDLMAGGDSGAWPGYFRAENILTNNPVTVHDWRKALIDVEQVQNASLDPVSDPGFNMGFNPVDGCITVRTSATPVKHVKLNLKGLHHVSLQANLTAQQQAYDADKQQQIKNGISSSALNTYYRYRNACEDILEAPTFLAEYPLMLKAKIAITDGTDPNDMMAAILFALYEYTAPTPRFMSLSDMQATGLRTDQIFNGPLLESGFLPDDVFALTQPASVIYLSEIMDRLSQLAGIDILMHQELWNCSQTTPVEVKDWMVNIPVRNVGLFSTKLHLLDTNAPIELLRHGVPLSINIDTVEAKLNQLKQGALNRYQQPLRLDPKAGTNRHPEAYTSIQTHFPDLYGINERGLTTSAPAGEQLMARQLKGYLLFFEQLLSDAHGQTAHIKELLSYTKVPTSSYTMQPLSKSTVPLLEQIIPDAQLDSYKTGMTALIENPSQQADYITSLDRIRNINEHLLARFGETINQYPQMDEANRIAARQRFLRSMASDGAGRGTGINLPDMKRAGHTISPLQLRIAHKLGLPQFSDRFVVTANPNFPGIRQFALYDDSTPKKLLLESYVHDNPGFQPLDADAVLQHEILTHGIETSTLPSGRTYNTNWTVEVDYKGVRKIVLYAPDGRMLTPYYAPERGYPVAQYVIPADQEPMNEADIEAHIKAVQDVLMYSFQYPGFYMVEHLLLRPRVEDANPTVPYYQNKFCKVPLITAGDTEGTLKFYTPLRSLADGDSVRVFGTRNYDGWVYPTEVKTDEGYFVANGKYLGDEAGYWYIGEQPAQWWMDQNEPLPANANKSQVRTSAPMPVEAWLPTAESGDPFSLQVSFVFPAFDPPFDQPAYQQQVETVIHQETPAHLYPYVRWMNADDWVKFTHYYDQFRMEYPVETVSS